MRNRFSFFAETVTPSTPTMPEPFSNIPHRGYCRGSILEAGAHPVYTLGRGRSPYERCFAFITKDMEGKQGRGGRGLTKLHTRAVVHRIHAAPNVACSSIERKVRGGREEEEGGGETHTPSSGGSDRTPGVSGEVFETLVACPRVDGPRRARRWVSTTSWRELAAHQRAPPPGYRVTDSP